MPWKDPEVRKAYHRAYMKKKQAEYGPRQTKYRKEHAAQYAEYQRKSRARNPKAHLVTAAKYRASRDNLPFDITVELLHWPTHCPVLGIELDYNRTSAGERSIRNNYPSLDRRVNELGYVQGNVFVISHRANRIKSDATVEEIEAVLKYMKN